jgi:hypothetical protein
MSERLNIYFYEDAFDQGYCLLALRGSIADHQPPLKRLLMLLIDIVEEHSRLDAQSIGLLAARAVAVLASETTDASLLPISKPPAADLAVGVRWLNQSEVWLSCKTVEPLVLGKTPLDAIDGFEGNVEQFREIVELIEWEVRAPKPEGSAP